MTAVLEDAWLGTCSWKQRDSGSDCWRPNLAKHLWQKIKRILKKDTDLSTKAWRSEILEYLDK